MMTKKDIVKKVQNHILKGGVVLAHKTKSITNGGKHFVSVGSYRTAVPDNSKRFAVLYTGKRPEAHHDSFHSGSYWAAHEFVTFIGNDQMFNARYL